MICANSSNSISPLPSLSMRLKRSAISTAVSLWPMCSRACEESGFRGVARVSRRGARLGHLVGADGAALVLVVQVEGGADLLDLLRRELDVLAVLVVVHHRPVRLHRGHVAHEHVAQLRDGRDLPEALDAPARVAPPLPPRGTPPRRARRVLRRGHDEHHLDDVAPLAVLGEPRLRFPHVVGHGQTARVAPG